MPGIPWLEGAVFNLLDFKRNALWDSNADSRTQDTVSGDLPLSPVLHYCPKEACPAGSRAQLSVPVSLLPTTPQPALI
jgi:hypothetical protein